MSARSAAREQVRMARARAKEIRRQARAEHKGRHRRAHGALAERQPSLTLGIIGLCTVLVVGALVVGALIGVQRSRTVTVMTHGNAEAVARAENADAPPLLLIDDSRNPSSKRARKQREQLIRKYQRQGYAVIEDEVLSEGVLGELLAQWRRKQADGVHEVIDTHLEEELARHNLYGLLHVTGGKRLDGQLVYSEREDAEERRWGTSEVAVAFAAPAPSPHPYLLVNDHPSAFDPEVAAEIERIVGQFRATGLKVIVDDEREASVRMALPPGRLDDDQPMPEILPVTIARGGLGGIVYVTTAPGDGPARDRILVRTIDADPEIVVEMGPPSPDGTAAVEATVESPEPPTEAPRDGGADAGVLPVAIGG